MDTSRQPPEGMQAERRWPRAPLTWRLPLGGWLALAVSAVLAVLITGMRFAQQSTRETAGLVGDVESRYEPVLRLSHDLGAAVAAFDRQVLEMPATVSVDTSGEVSSSGARMMTIFGRLAALAPGHPAIVGSAIRERLEDLQRQGLATSELYRQRSATVQQSLDALDSLATRAARAASGVESGDQVFARKSLAELSRSAAALSTSSMQLFADPSPARADDVRHDRAAFGTLMHASSAEWAQSPGRAWLELERDDFAAFSSREARFLEIERRIGTAHAAFDAAAQQLSAMIEADLERPAWSALTQAATQARLTAVKAETHLARVATGVLAVVLAVAATIGYGILGPTRKLLEGTRRLARGQRDARVARGGVRELDELAAAFNDMARALDTTQQALHAQQLALEDRVAERTEQLRHLANHDPLTGLPNRRELETHLVAAVTRARTDATGCAVFYIDVDNFKTINDSLGHQFGDQVLREIGARFQEAAGSNTFLARLGGDEFTLVVDGIASGKEAEAFVERIMQAFQRPIVTEQRELLVSLSIGIAVCPQHGDSAEALLRAADSALFHAKDRGRNGFSLYRKELLAAASHRFHTEQGLRRALEAGDLALHFQPEVSLVDLNTTTVEALLRWRQPDGRVAAAAEFMAIAEQSGLVLELNDWVLRHAIEAARRLRRDVWPRARVAVNVSAQQFLTGRFVESVERALRAAQMPAECLEIELTEIALQTGRVAVDALHDLRRIGAAVALDDFGAGYSSLKSIDELPLTRVKLDQGLTHGIASKGSAAAIAMSVIRLCQGLGLTVTAEGIERPEQLDFLADCGEIQVQGYLIARPAPIEEIGAFIADTPARMAAIWRRAVPARSQQVLTTEPSTVTQLRPRLR